MHFCANFLVGSKIPFPNKRLMLLKKNQTIQSKATKMQTSSTGTAAVDLKLLANEWLLLPQRLILSPSVTAGPRDSLTPVPAEAGSTWKPVVASHLTSGIRPASARLKTASRNPCASLGSDRGGSAGMESVPPAVLTLSVIFQVARTFKLTLKLTIPSRKTETQDYFSVKMQWNCRSHLVVFV